MMGTSGLRSRGLYTPPIISPCLISAFGLQSGNAIRCKQHLPFRFGLPRIHIRMKCPVRDCRKGGGGCPRSGRRRSHVTPANFAGFVPFLPPPSTRISTHMDGLTWLRIRLRPSASAWNPKRRPIYWLRPRTYPLPVKARKERVSDRLVFEAHVNDGCSSGQKSPRRFKSFLCCQRSGWEARQQLAEFRRSNLLCRQALFDLCFDGKTVAIPPGTYGAYWPARLLLFTSRSFRIL